MNGIDFQFEGASLNSKKIDARCPLILCEQVQSCRHTHSRHTACRRRTRQP